MEGEERGRREEGRVKRTKGCDLMLELELERGGKGPGRGETHAAGGMKTGRGGEQRGETQNRESGRRERGRQERGLEQGKGERKKKKSGSVTNNADMEEREGWSERGSDGGWEGGRRIN